MSNPRLADHPKPRLAPSPLLTRWGPASAQLEPKNEKLNLDFSFSNYIHVLYRSDDFIKLDADAVEGITGWRLTSGGTDSRAVARGGAGGGVGYTFHSQKNVCFCAARPCTHAVFTGTPEVHKVCAASQETADRAQATDFFATVVAGTPLASVGEVEDATSAGEPIWFSISKGEARREPAVHTAPRHRPPPPAPAQVTANPEKFTAAGGAGASGTRTIAKGWSFVDVQWLVKIKTDTDGNIHYEPWRQPHDERTAHTPGSRTVNRSALQCPLGIKRPGLRRLGCPTSSPLCLLLPQVLTKPKMLSVKVEWLRVEERVGAPTRYVISAAAYQRLLEAVR